MHSGRGGMGSHKHGTSGHAPKSPKLRIAMKLAAARAGKSAPPRTEMKPSVKEVFKRKR